MVTQYPHHATWPLKATESSLDDNGVWVTTENTDQDSNTGRYEPSTNNNETFLVDGVQQKLKGIFYMPVNADEVYAGAVFTVYNTDGSLILTEKVLFFTRGQLNCRVYL
jgi:hypothetical protein